MDWDLVERAQQVAGLKGYVTNIDPEIMTGEQVVAAYHDLYQVERSFRMTKSDLAARPVFHRLRDSIEAHLTVVFAALAVSREAQARTGMSINKIVKTLRPLRTATITLGGQQIRSHHASPPRRNDYSTPSMVVTKPIQLRPDPAARLATERTAAAERVAALPRRSRRWPNSRPSPRTTTSTTPRG